MYSTVSGFRSQVSDYKFQVSDLQVPRMLELGQFDLGQFLVVQKF